MLLFLKKKDYSFASSIIESAKSYTSNSVEQSENGGNVGDGSVEDPVDETTTVDGDVRVSERQERGREEPVIDEDGFELVTSKRKVHR